MTHLPPERISCDVDPPLLKPVLADAKHYIGGILHLPLEDRVKVTLAYAASLPKRILREIMWEEFSHGHLKEHKRQAALSFDVFIVHFSLGFALLFGTHVLVLTGLASPKALPIVWTFFSGCASTTAIYWRLYCNANDRYERQITEHHSQQYLSTSTQIERRLAKDE